MTLEKQPVNATPPPNTRPAEPARFLRRPTVIIRPNGRRDAKTVPVPPVANVADRRRLFFKGLSAMV
jgi:hypothetical protein